MNRVTGHTRKAKSVLVAAVLAWVVGTSPGLGAEAITGDWEMTMQFGSQTSFATLSVTKQADGTLAGRWGSNELSNVKFDGQKLTFNRTIRMGDQEFTMSYNGTLADGKLAGLMSSDRGEFEVNGARPQPKCPALGHWDIAFTAGDFDIKARLSVSQTAAGALEGKWTENIGEHTVSAITFQDGKLAVTRQSKVEDFDFESTYKATIEGDDLKGTMGSPMGEIVANGRRFGSKLIGKWELTTTTDRGARTRMLTIYGDLTGRYESFGGEIPINEIVLEGDEVTFFIERSFGDRTFRTDFKAKLDGASLSGEITTARGTSEVKGKKLTMTSPVVGTWEFTRETPQGTRTSTLRIKKDRTGTYAFRENENPVTDLVIEGNQVSFTLTFRRNEREFKMQFKGKAEGDTLTGAFTTPRGTREAIGKKQD